MRINLAKKLPPLQDKIIKELVASYAEEYAIPATTALSYVTIGKQGLQSFISYVKDRFNLKFEMYCLHPNTDLFKNVDSQFDDIRRTSVSYGLVVDDNDPVFVALKIKHL